MSRMTDKLDKEIEEMESAMNNSPAPEEEAVVVDPSHQFDLNPEPEEPSEEIAEPVVEDVEEDADDDDEVPSESKPKRVSWKKRYSTYKASSDATIYSLRQEVVQAMTTVDKLRTQVNELTKSIADKQPDPFKSAFTSEDMDIFGEDAVNSMQRATENAIAPLKRELEETRKKLQEKELADVQNQTVQAKTIFLNKLADAVPDYAEIDTDKKFAEWITGIDENSGFSRLHLFKTAEKNGDVGRVASFMNEFKATRATKVNPLDSKVTPTSSSTAKATSVVPEQITQAYINKFYADYAAGKYRGREKEAQAIERKIDKAYMAL